MLQLFLYSVSTSEIMNLALGVFYDLILGLAVLSICAFSRQVILAQV
jgi:hypothetical protein